MKLSGPLADWSLATQQPQQASVNRPPSERQTGTEQCTTEDCRGAQRLRSGLSLRGRAEGSSSRARRDRRASAMAEKRHVEKKYFYILLWELRVEGLFLSFLWQILSFLLCRLKLKGTIRLPALAAPSGVIRRTGLGASWLAWDYLLNVFLQIAPLRAPSSSVVVHVQTDKKAHSRDTSWLSLPSMSQAPKKHFFSP